MPLATSNFLVPNGTFIVVLLAFLVVVWVIGKKVLPVLNKALTERQDQIRGELEAADKAKADAEDADAERRAALEQARAQAREIVSNAATAADQTKLRAEADAQAIHDRIVQTAEAEVVVARQAAVEEVTARVGEIVLAAAERVIGREIRASDHQDLIDEAIAAVRAESSPMPPPCGRRRSVNPALQGYLAAMEESLAAAGGLADAAAELASVAELVDGSTELTLAINDGSVPVAARRAVLDHLLEGRVRPEVRSLIHQAVTVVPAGELTASFHWLAVAGGPGRRRGHRPPRPSPTPRRSSVVWPHATGCRATPPPCSRR